MFHLMQNELIKIFKRNNTYILLLIGLAVILSYNIFAKLNNSVQDVSNQYKRAYNNDKLILENYDSLQIKDSLEDIKERITLEQYAIQNNIKYNILLNSQNKNVIIPVDARSLLIKTFNNFDIIIVFLLIYFSTTILSEEYTTGTIKTLLTKPYKRTKILLSKIICLVFITILLLFTVLLIQMILGGILFGFESYSLEAIRYNVVTKSIDTMNLSFYMLMISLCKMPMYLLLILIGLLLGVITNNISLNILILLGLYILSTLKFLINNFTKYIFIFCWDISKFLFTEVTITNYLVISIVSIIILFSLLLFIFKKMDIKNV